MSRINLVIFLLVVLVAVVIEAERKCKRYRTTCYPKKPCTTVCIKRGRRDVSGALEGEVDGFEQQKFARELEENARRFEYDVNDEAETRNADDDEEEPEARIIDDVLEEEARDVDDNLDEEEERNLDEE